MVGRGGAAARRPAPRHRTGPARRRAGAAPWPNAARRLEDPPRLVGAEDAGLAEDVREAARPWAATPGSCSSMSDRTNASVPSGRDRNSGGTAWAPSHVGTTSIGPSRAQPVRDLEQPELGLEVEAVARLGLDRRDAVAEHLVEPAPAVRRGARRRTRHGSRRRSTGSRRPRPGSRDSRRRAGAARARPRACPRTAGGCAGR